VNQVTWLINNINNKDNNVTLRYVTLLHVITKYNTNL